MSASTAESLLETLKKKLLAFKINVKTLTLELERKQALLKDEKDKREKVPHEHFICIFCSNFLG